MSSKGSATQKTKMNGTKLRVFLNAQKKASLAGPPPTQTTSMLESLLDDKPKKKRTRAIKPKGSGPKPRTVNDIKPEMKHRNISRDDSTVVKSAWSKIDLGSRKRGTDVEPVKSKSSSAKTLDDLLSQNPSKPFPLAHRSVSQKRVARKVENAMYDLNESPMPSNKGADLYSMPKANSKRSSRSHENMETFQSVPVGLNLPGSRRKSSLKRKRFLSPSASSSKLIKSATMESNFRKTLPSTDATNLPSLGSSTHTRTIPNTELQQENMTTRMTLPIQKRATFEPPTYQSAATLNSSANSLSQSINNSTQLELPPKSSRLQKKPKAVNNDNFVRLNLRNTAGSCKGARSLKQHNRMKRRRAEYKLRTGQLGVEESEGNDDESGTDTIVQKYKPKSHGNRKRMMSIHAAIDPLDDFLDGTFHTTKSKKTTQKKDAHEEQSQPKHPSCPRHQRQCKLLVVKKNTTGNKGRKFYVCSMPRGEQCEFFQWKDDTIESAQIALQRSSSTSGFVARQVAGHVDRLKTLTLPELRIEAKKRGLNHTGKKLSILTRLSVWVRDEVSSTVCVDEDDAEENNSPILQDSEDNPGSDVESTAVSDKESEHGSDTDDESDSSEDELEICGLNSSSLTRNYKESGPVDRRIRSRSSIPKSPLHSSLFDIFGYSDFRQGQEWAIRRCLDKKKSLLVAPTGQGKSLCYALPAALMDGVCIVVSPLVSLMEDQLRQLPPTIPAATLSGSMTTEKMAMIIDDLIRNRLKILFVSPERLASAAFRRLLRPKYNTETMTFERQLPIVSLLCVDEAHCLSQWGHNFRFAFLRLRILLSSLNPQSVLALTATAGPPVMKDICHTLRIPMAEGEVVDNQDLMEEPSSSVGGVNVLSCNRDNIDVAVSFLDNAGERLSLLEKLLKTPTNERIGMDSDVESSKVKAEGNPIRDGVLSKGSVIVYVWRQKDAEVVTEQLTASNIPGGVVCYHGGMDSTARSKSQSRFMRGKARICVATVAFGLGINKADVRGVIHLCLPPSPEHYLQEVGRAGRDGKQASGISLILHSEAPHKLSLSYSDKISVCQIHTLFLNMKHLATECLSLDKTTDGDSTPAPQKLELALPIDPLVQATDCKEESIQTILSILEDDSPSSVKLLDIEGIIPNIATVTLKRRTIEKLAALEPVAKCIEQCEASQPNKQKDGSSEHDHLKQYGGTAQQKGFTAYSFGVHEFSIVKCARLLGPTAEPRHVFAALRRLQNIGELELSFNNVGKSIHLRLNMEGVEFFGGKEEELHENTNTQDRFARLSNAICDHFESQDTRRARKVLAMHRIMRQVSSVQKDDIEFKEERSNGGIKSKRLECFQEMIEAYFLDTSEKAAIETSDLDESIGVCSASNKDPATLTCIAADVTNLLKHPSLTKSCTSFPSSVQFGEMVGSTDYTSLVLTKVFHGIDSPRTPVLEWFRHPLWGKWRNYEFGSLKGYIEKTLIH